jgi:hypothetical protein
MLWLAAGVALSGAVVPASLAHGATLDCLIEPYIVVSVAAAVEGLVERVEV